MPLYEYQCEQCGDHFEVIQKFTDEPLTRHEKCGGPVHRLLSPPALQFKGSGWYITDYAKGGGAKSDNGAPAKSDASPAAKTGSDSGSTPAATPSSSETKSGSDTKS